MEGLTLSQQEQICYGELFQTCDVDGTGRITGVRASDLFLSSGLSQDHLMQVTELCGAKRLGHFGRSQFYIALKLIAVAQLGLPVKLDSLNTGKDIPLPKFTRQNQNDIDKRLVPPPQSTTQELSVADRPPVQGSAQQPMQTAAGQLPPPPANKKSHSRNLSGQYRSVDQQGQINSRDDSPHNAKSPPFSPKQSPPSSPPVIPPTQNAIQPIPTASTIPAVVPVTANQNSFPANTPTVIPSGAQTTIQTGPSGGPSGGPPAGYVANSMNSTHEAGWASFEDDGSECHGLLGTGPKKTYNLEAPGFDSSSISSDPESVDDIWSINEEQRDYYVKQFQIMQPDLGGAILGGIAKDFFEKSKLPVHELSKIWQLSDLNRDGALSLEEFCIAMHLVVLRRNEIELPDRLPFSLMPYSAFTNGELNLSHEEPFAADLPPGSTLKRTTPPSSPPAQQSGGAHWAQSLIQESPQTSSEMSSPSIKPANFEFSKPVPSDPEAKIVHPVAVRMSPESQRYPPEGVEREPAPLVDTSFSDQSEPLQTDPNMSTAATTITTVTVTTKQRSNTETSYTAETTPTVQQNDSGAGSKAAPASQGPITLVSRPRPVPKKANPVPGGVGGLLIPVPVTSQPGTGEGAVDRPPLSSTHSLDNVVNQEPPRPPPRPGAQPHSRSLSVDLIGIGLSTPPAVPPRTSPKDSPAYRRTADGAVVVTDKKNKFPEVKKFESIPSQEVLVLPEIDSVDGSKSVEDSDRTRRNLSQDYTKLEPNVSQGPESGDSTTSSGGVKVTSPGVTFDLPTEDEAGGGEKQRAPIFAMRQVSRDKKDLQMAIRTHKERNTMLERLNSELNQELQEVMEQRIALEIQLEHLKPFTS
ncbi:ralBP1-associated Eps domain-containing protein 1-like isoform X2 [Pecten maximus]|uniref:ralBP1-associated Eps domain-containing protein 1-like isoform X2 n=1 Tax=Pecten maximus TaxID=6579 RepID=UPI00145882A9|nr:ralBP1-associated Eps domain-containing protein 1-like isoform X2 [Pecten maximus]